MKSPANGSSSSITVFRLLSTVIDEPVSSITLPLLNSNLGCFLIQKMTTAATMIATAATAPTAIPAIAPFPILLSVPKFASLSRTNSFDFENSID